MTTYSQWTAYKALTKAALISMLKSPSSIVFSLAFPLIFILVFGMIGDSSKSAIPVSFVTGTDTTTPIYKAIATSPLFTIASAPNDEQKISALSKGDIAALLRLSKQQVVIKTTVHKTNELQALRHLLYSYAYHQGQHSPASISISTLMQESRPYKRIDFILPGQLGFSLLAASVFGTAFVFYSLRNTLVLKRFFATPIQKPYILLAEGTARMIFQLVGAAIIILVGRFLFDFTLIKGWITVLELLLLCALGLMVFMSFGFAISGIARSESTIPPLANIFTLPQFLLAGTFFPVSALPVWLQWLAKLMPLTHLNEALRRVAFDGNNLWEIRVEILILLVWGVIGYGLAAKLFKWE